MYIGYSNRKIQKICEDFKKAAKYSNPSVALSLTTRLNEFSAADHLGEISHLPPQRKHMLKGSYKHHYAVDLTCRYRLIFYPCDIEGDLIETNSDFNPAKIECIVITEVSNHYDD